MPDPDEYIAKQSYFAGDIYTIAGLLDKDYSSDDKNVVTIKAKNINKTGFFFNLSPSYFGNNVTMTLLSEINVKEVDHTRTMVVLGSDAGQFEFKKINNTSQTVHLKTDINSEFYVVYQGKSLDQTLEDYLKSVEKSDYNKNLTMVNIGEDDILFCVISNDKKGPVISGQEKGVNLVKEFKLFGGHNPVDQSTLGKVHIINKGDLSKLSSIKIPEKSTSYGFFISARSINTEFPELSRGCWIAFGK